MAHVSELLCNEGGACMSCKEKPSNKDKLTCKTCVTPWHLACLKTCSETLASALHYECPDCTSIVVSVAATSVENAASEAFDDLIWKIRAIEADASLTDREKAKKQQELVIEKVCYDDDADKKKKKKRKRGEKDVLDVLDGSLNCSRVFFSP